MRSSGKPFDRFKPKLQPEPGSRLEFTPKDAFLFAIGEAINKTAGSLTEAGLEPELIWSAFNQALMEVRIAVIELNLDFGDTESRP